MANPQMSVNPKSRPDATTPLEVHPGLQGTFDHPTELATDADLATDAAELHQLRAERDQLAERQQQIAELLRSANPDKIVHDLRNVLNELQLYKMLVETQNPQA